VDDDDGEIREILSDFILGQIISHLISSHLISSLSLSLQLCVLSRSLSVFFFFFFRQPPLVFVVSAKKTGKNSIDMSKE